MTDVAASATQSTRRPRNVGIEWLRIASAVGLVLFHVDPPGGLFNRSALVVFIGISVLLEFALPGRRERSLAQLARGCLLPWLSWSVLYGLRNLVKGDALSPAAIPWLGLLTGTAAHLWYMPYFFVLSLAIQWIRRSGRPSLMLWGLFALALVTNVSAPLWWMLHDSRTPGHLPVPVSEWVMVAPYASALVAGAYAVSKPDLAGSRWIPWLLMGLAAVGCLVSAIEVYALMLWGGALLTITWIWGWKVPSLPMITRLSDAAFGVYLAHVLVFGGLKIALHRVLHHDVAPSAGLGLVVAALSFAFVLALHRWAPKARPWLG